MKKYIMILIIILGVICCDLAFCQLDKSVLIIHYGDVNYYAENENYWAEINGRNVEFTDKKSENKKIKPFFHTVEDKIQKKSPKILTNYGERRIRLFCS